MTTQPIGTLGDENHPVPDYYDQLRLGRSAADAIELLGEAIIGRMRDVVPGNGFDRIDVALGKMPTLPSTQRPVRALTATYQDGDRIIMLDESLTSVEMLRALVAELEALEQLCDPG